MYLVPSAKNTARPNVAFTAYQTIDIEGRPAVDLIIIRQDEIKDGMWRTTKQWNVTNWQDQAPYFRMIRLWALRLPTTKNPEGRDIIELNDEQEQLIEKFALWYQDHGMEKGIPNPLD